MRYDVVIVGAGLAGLAAGIRLAQFDRRVLILERHWLWGGLNSFYKKQGVLYDVGLHAVTNYGESGPSPAGGRPPLKRLCRQLRIRFEELDLVPQGRSSIRFDDSVLPLTNQYEDFVSAAEQIWRSEGAGLRALAHDVRYPDTLSDRAFVSAREQLERYISEQLLREMILLPLFYYGNARSDDMDWGDFQVLFSSIFLEGLCRPRAGMRPFLGLLRRRFLQAGGTLWCNSAVTGIEDGEPVRVHVQGKGEVQASQVLSSAGRTETARLLGTAESCESGSEPRLSFMETAWVLRRDPSAYGYDDCVTFFNRGCAVRWRTPEEDVDTASGVLCCPNHYPGSSSPSQVVLRATHLARPESFLGVDGEEYRRRKDEAESRILAAAESWVGSFGRDIVQKDAFTPATVYHYTGHDGGAIYGSAVKAPTGATGSPRVHLIGTDQGLVGIVGAMTSGVAIANARVLA
ncbi:MAG: FAD-dependent oxidoreductase [Myxococcota bacterium]